MKWSELRSHIVINPVIHLVLPQVNLLQGVRELLVKDGLASPLVAVQVVVLADRIVELNKFFDDLIPVCV